MPHTDQNQVAKASAERRQKGQIKRKIQSHESSSGFAFPDTSLVIYSPLPESQDVYAHQFFVSAYVTATRDPRTEHGFLELLPLLFDKLPTNSVLSLSLAAVSHCFFGAWEPAIRNAEQLTVQKNYTKALGALRKALQDPQECVSDEVLMAVCLLSFFEERDTDASSQETVSTLMSRKKAEDHIKGATALITQRRSSTMTSELSKRLLIAVSSALANSMPVREASEIWQDPGQMPYNPATSLDAMRVQVANVLATAAQYASPGKVESLSDERRSKILSRAKAAISRYESWPSLVPQDWWPIPLQRSLIPQPIIDTGAHGDHCDLYPSVSVCETWLIWYTSRVRILSLIADLDQSESKQHAVLQMQQTADDIFAAVPYVLGSKSDPAGMYDTEFVYPCLPGDNVSLNHYRCAAAFGGLALWIPLRTLLENMRHLRNNQTQFSLEQITRLGRLYDVRMPSLKKPPGAEV
ncbi:MAG: hypothetical protein LQ343_006521 [Gyalolechia ehrenbergii]|nr:MAG: hypothetical protein LQ343_006521 [Gyalolechia ehrenbergii]